MLFRLFVNPYSAVLYGLVFLFLLVLLRVLLRSGLLAALVWALLVAGPFPARTRSSRGPYGGVRAAAFYVALTRGGLLRLVVTLFCLFSLLEAPLTLERFRVVRAALAPRAADDRRAQRLRLPHLARGQAGVRPAAGGLSLRPAPGTLRLRKRTAASPSKDPPSSAAAYVSRPGGTRLEARRPCSIGYSLT